MDTCPPCQDIAPGYEELMNMYDDVLFYKIDIYEHLDLAMSLDLPGAPAFMFWVNGDKEPVDTVTATSVEELPLVEAAVEEVVNMYNDKINSAVLAQTSRRPVLAQKFSALF